MTPKIALDALRSDWVERRSAELILATNKKTDEEDQAQLASGACDALTGALYDLAHLPDLNNPSLGTFEILEQLIVSRSDEADTERLNWIPGHQPLEYMKILGQVEGFRRVLEDIRRKQTTLPGW